MLQHHSQKNNANSSNGQSRRWLPQQPQRTPKPLHQQPPYHHSYQPPIYHVQTNRTTLHQAKMPMSNYGYSKWSNTSASPTSRKNATWSTRQHFFAAQPFRGGVPNYSTIDHYPPPGTISRKSCNKHFHPLIKSNGHETNFRVYDRHTQFKTTSGDSRACALTSPTLSKGKSWIALYGDSKHQLEKKSNSAASPISRKFYKRHKGWTPSITRPAVPSPTHHFTEAPRKNRHQWNSEFYKEDLDTKNNISLLREPITAQTIHQQQSTSTMLNAPRYSHNDLVLLLQKHKELFFAKMEAAFTAADSDILQQIAQSVPNALEMFNTRETLEGGHRPAQTMPHVNSVYTPSSASGSDPCQNEESFLSVNQPSCPSTNDHHKPPHLIGGSTAYRPFPSIPNKDKPGHLDVNHEQLWYEEDLVLSPVSSTKLPCMHANAPPSPCNK